MQIQRLKDLREDNDLTQEQVAEKLFITRSAYSNYELGIRDIPLDILGRIADLFNTSVDYLLDRTDETIPYKRKDSK